MDVISNVICIFLDVSKSPIDLSYKLQSKIGKSLFHVLGFCDEVKEFDENHTLYKIYHYESSRQICQRLKKEMKKKVKKAMETSKESLETWERDFFSKHLTEPHSTDMDVDTLLNYRKVKHAKSILKIWC